jgi:hypothetical protein
VTGYKKGNCAHCHDQHASRGGTTHDPQDFALFVENFNTSATSEPYQEADNICFRCHNDSGSTMQLLNKNYAQTFGGFTPGYAVNSIFDALALGPDTTNTYHNLLDVYNYAKDNFSFFTAGSNPCAACHNPHLAKRNKSDVDDPSLTAISRPTDHNNLWGDDAAERMDSYASGLSGEYQPPYYYNSTTTYEPGGIADHDGDKMPDYNTFCLDCHANEVATTNAGTVSRNVSNPPTNGYLSAINWGSGGDMHGGAPRIGDPYSTAAGATLKEPYDTTLGGTSPNYVLSCLDCHEPHGTVLYNYGDPVVYSYLIRKEINGATVDCVGCGGGQDDADWNTLGLCQRCHNIGAHCGPAGSCLDCHYHGSTKDDGCSADWAYQKAF